MKNLAREAKLARESFVGKEAQKWALPRFWAWAHQCGRTHFRVPMPTRIGRPPSSTACPIFWAPNYKLASHVSGHHICPQPSTIHDHHRPRPVMDTHEILNSHHVIWAATENLGSWTATHVHEILGTHTYIVGCQQLQALGAQTCGQYHAFWATTALWVPMQRCGGAWFVVGVCGRTRIRAKQNPQPLWG